MDRRRRRTSPRRMAPQRRAATPGRVAALLACVVVPAIALAVGCSSGSGGSDASPSPSASAPSTPATPTLAPAKYAKLPASCATVSRATVKALVPKAKSAGGTEARSSDLGTRGGCSWTGNGKDGYQYRWLSVTLQRFANSTALGAADAQARKQYADQLADLGGTSGFTTTPVPGIGDEAAAVNGRATVAKVTSQNSTLVARTGNVVVIVEYNGAGLAGKKNPGAQTVRDGSRQAAEDAVAAVARANAAANA